MVPPCCLIISTRPEDATEILRAGDKVASATSNRLHPDCPLAVNSSPLTGDCCSARHFFICKRRWIGVDLIDMGAGTIRTLIVDDEPIARRTLHQELEIFADVEVVGEAENGKDALR